MSRLLEALRSIRDNGPSTSSGICHNVNLLVKGAAGKAAARAAIQQLYAAFRVLRPDDDVHYPVSIDGYSPEDLYDNVFNAWEVRQPWDWPNYLGLTTDELQAYIDARHTLLHDLINYLEQQQ